MKWCKTVHKCYFLTKYELIISTITFFKVVTAYSSELLDLNRIFCVIL